MFYKKKRSNPYLKSFVLLSFCLLISVSSRGQERISEVIQQSNTASQKDNSLYFIDFWATWCAPCITVSKYLEVLQKQYPNRLYIVSLSQESPDVINRFFKKHTTDLAVALDYEGETFKKYNVTSFLPYGVLLNINGDVLWEGHPANFKSDHVNKFLRKNTKRTAFKDMFKLVLKKTVVNEVYQPELDFEFKEISKKDFQIKYTETYMELSGSLQDILAYALKTNIEQVKISETVNKQYQMLFKYNTEAFNTMATPILDKLQLKKTEGFVAGEVLIFDIKKPTFWNTDQIDWGINNSKYLISDSQIQADNVSLKDLIYNLSLVLNIPIVIKQKRIDTTMKHDWEVHYKFYSLMQTDLYENYGIKVIKENANYPEYIITKKAP